MKKLAFMVVVLCGLLMAGNSAMASVTLSFDPVTTAAAVGGPVTVNLNVSGLESVDLGAYDLNVNYDSNILSFVGYTLGGGLGYTTGDSLDFSWGDLGFGQINLSEVSMLSDLSAQGSSFTLATLTFTGIAGGSSALTISDITLGDANGDSIVPDSLGSANVNVVPIPAAAWLLGSCLMGLFGFRKRLG